MNLKYCYSTRRATQNISTIRSFPTIDLCTSRVAAVKSFGKTFHSIRHLLHGVSHWQVMGGLERRSALCQTREAA